MKQRIISALVGLVLFFVVLIFIETVVLNITIGIVLVIAVGEMLGALKLFKYKALSLLSLLFSFTIPFVNVVGFNVVYFAIFAILVYCMFIFLLKRHEQLKFEHLCMVFTVSTLIPLSFSSIIFLRDHYASTSIFYILLIFAMGWGSDSAAYFAGRFLGKTKLAPKISPNKTVEGLLGGIVGSVFFVTLISLIYQVAMGFVGVTVAYDWGWLIIVSIIGCLAGVMGDLVFSAIKRQYKIKDYGTIMPGHGGVLDRFDSVCFIAPLFYLFTRVVPLIV